MRRFDAGATGVAVGVGLATLPDYVLFTDPSWRELADRVVFLSIAAYLVSALVWAVGVRLRRGARWSLRRDPLCVRADHGVAALCAGGVRALRPLSPRRLAGFAILTLLVLGQTTLHADERAPFLYMTYPAFQGGAGTSADGYVAWIDGHPTFAESWQFADMAEVLGGASRDVSTGDTDARAAYAYVAALLNKPLGAYTAFVGINVAFWLAACVAIWYVARALLGSEPAGYLAAVLTACGEGFVFTASTPMSYVAGYAWSALLLALALRWRLFARRSDWRRWLMWGWACGVAGLFFFTHIVVLGSAWLFGAARAPFRGLAAATAVALALPAAWFVIGTRAMGLEFAQTTANDLFGQLRALGALALRDPLRVPTVSGSQSAHVLVGCFGVPLLVMAVLGFATAAPRRREWYAAVATFGLAPALILHQNPVTQRYGYLAFPALYVAGAEGTVWLAIRLRTWLERNGHAAGSRLVPILLPAAVAGAQLAQANADLVGVYVFALAFGAV